MTDLSAMDEPELAAHLAALDGADVERKARLRAPDALLSAARWYAGIGWPVFPCQPRGKQPLTRNGFKDATTDLEQVGAWWKATPTANIGIPTGVAFDVIDIDGPPGFDSLVKLRDTGTLPTVLATTFTPRGRHLLITPTGDSNAAAMMPGVDYRGYGGYIIVPPSVGASGDIYEWVQAPDLSAFRG